MVLELTTGEVLEELYNIKAPNILLCLGTIINHACPMCPIYEECLEHRCPWHENKYSVEP